jgi:hypothetical protein
MSDHFPPCLRPLSIRRRMASDRDGLSSWRLAQASTVLRDSGAMRSAISGSLPVAGRPRFLGITFSVDLLAMGGLYINLG